MTTRGSSRPRPRTLRPAGRGARWLAATGLALLVLLGGAPAVLLAGTPPGPRSGGGGVTGPTGAPVNENVSLSLPNPSSPGPGGSRTALNGSVGDVLTVSVNVSLGSFSPSWGLYQLHMPTLSVRFPLFGGTNPQFPLTVASKNLTYAQNGSATYQGTVTLSQVAEFRPGLNATLTTNGYAPSASLPWGTVAVNVTWSYSLNSSNGTVVAAAGPGGPQSVFPALTFGLAYAGPASILLGTQYTVCLNGPVLNRTFGLRGVNATGVVFANITSTVASGTTGCLTVPVPANVTGGRITVQLWEYTTEPIRLRPLPATTTTGPVARLQGVVQPTNVSTLVTVDSVPVVATSGGSYAIGFAPGAHHVFYNASGYWPQATTVNVSAGETQWMNLTLLPRTQEPTHFGPPPLLNLTPLQSGVLIAALLLVVLLAVIAVRQRRRPPPTGAPPTSAGAAEADAGT